MFEDLKKVVESKKLIGDEWQKETDPVAREFGRQMDKGVETPFEEAKFNIGYVKIRVLNFNTVFENLVKKCGRIRFENSGNGVIMSKDLSFGMEDAKKVIKRLDSKDKGWKVNINLQKQAELYPAPCVLTVLDARILE